MSLAKDLEIRTILPSPALDAVDGEGGWEKIPVPDELKPSGNWRRLVAARSASGTVVVLGVPDSPETENWPKSGQYEVLAVRPASN